MVIVPTQRIYRPISTLSTLAQIFEKSVYEQLIGCIEKQEILFPHQFGSRKVHSTAQAILETTDNLRKAIDQNLYTCGVFLDFSKAIQSITRFY